MEDGLDQLTDKERDALRLLLAGFDAKSSGRELGISHHTINDRLRSARRKLGVTTSREAARILGEREGTIPEPLVHTPLGNANSTRPTHDQSSAEEDPIQWRSGWRGKGLILMSLAIAAALGAAFISGVSPMSSSGTRDTSKQAESAEGGLAARIENAQSLDEARAFLAALDEGNAEASYAATAGKLRANQGFKLWELGVALRNNRADFSNRKIVGAGGRDDVPEPGEWAREVFIFKSTDGDRTLTEYIITQRFEDGWKVVDYDLRGLDDEEE